MENRFFFKQEFDQQYGVPFQNPYSYTPPNNNNPQYPNIQGGGNDTNFQLMEQVCGICNLMGHATEYCPTIFTGGEVWTEQPNTFVGYTEPYENSYSNFHQPGWTDHPSCGWQNDQHMYNPQTQFQTSFQPQGPPIYPNFHTPQNPIQEQTFFHPHQDHNSYPHQSQSSEERLENIFEQFMQAQMTLNTQTSNSLDDIKNHLIMLTESLDTQERSASPIQTTPPQTQFECELPTPQNEVYSNPEGECNGGEVSVDEERDEIREIEVREEGEKVSEIELEKCPILDTRSIAHTSPPTMLLEKPFAATPNIIINRRNGTWLFGNVIIKLDIFDNAKQLGNEEEIYVQHAQSSQQISDDSFSTHPIEPKLEEIISLFLKMMDRKKRQWDVF